MRHAEAVPFQGKPDSSILLQAESTLSLFLMADG
jgi:hypothetical protein